MTERLLTKKNLKDFGLFAVFFHAIITFVPYFFGINTWIYTVDYIILGLTGFAGIFFLAKKQIPIRLQPAQMLLIIFFVWYIVSCIFNTVQTDQDLITYNSYATLNIVVAIVLAFPLGYVMIREGKNSFGRILLHILLIGWTLVITFILINIFQGKQIVTPNNGIIRMHEGALQINCNQNTTGAWELLFFLGCCFMILWSKQLLLKVIYGIFSIVHFTTLTLSNCRAGFLAAFAGFMAFAGIAVYLWLDKDKKPHCLLIAIIVALAAGVAYYFLSQLVFSLYNLATGAKSSGRAFVTQEQTFSGREQVWQYAIEGIFSSFRAAVFGFTPVSVPEMISQMSGGELDVYTHNQFLEIAAGTGIPGMCIFLVWFYMIMRDSYKLFFVQKDRTLVLLIPVIIIALMLENMMEAILIFYEFIHAYVFFFLCGIVYGIVNKPIKEPTLKQISIRCRQRKKKK